jgi:succinate-semialdehyde dehydrogenase/glutarate-semialdehyde dehydrogenase
MIGSDAPDTTETLKVENPADGTELARLPVAEARHIDAALDAAEAGFRRWSRMTALERANILHDAADLLRRRAPEIATAITLEQGKPLAEARGEVAVSADILDWQAEEGRRIYGRVVPSRISSVRQLVNRESLGAVALFSPWNFPMLLLMQKIAASLGAGCSVVAKPAEETPAAALAIAHAIRDAGAPDGTVNVLFGNPAEISKRLIASPVIRKISLTGSIRVGRILGCLAGEHLKKVTLELGGHAPVIVTADANIEKAAQLLSAHKYRNAGQVCVAPTRFLVEAPVAQSFIDHFLEQMHRITVGNGLDPETGMGPLASARQVERTRTIIEDARARGAAVETGHVPASNTGHFHAPTSLIDTPADALAMNEEPFGPIAVFHKVGSLDEAVAKANALPYALGAYAFTSSHDTARRIADEVEAGMIAINHTTISTPETPFGGMKDSGFGSEGGIESIIDYTHPKLVSDAPAWS